MKIEVQARHSAKTDVGRMQKLWIAAREMMRVRVIAAFLLIIFSNACSAPTAYAPARNGVGYAEQQLETRRFRVSFTGNASTGRDMVENHMLYRAAELTVMRGFDHFEIVDQTVEAMTRYHGFAHDLGPGHDLESDRRTGRHGDFSRILPTDLTPITRYHAVANIIMHSGAKPDGAADRYDARDLMRRLEAAILRP